MLRFILPFVLLYTLVDARENPFFPVSGMQDIPLTSNQTETIPPLKQATITLPSTARTIESVTVRYKNIDGSIAEKKLQLSNSIDWHLPLFISQSYCAQEVKQRSPKSKKAHKYKQIASFGFIKFYADGKTIKVITKDKLLRHFLLVKPHRIVCDFKNDIDIRSYEKQILKKSSVFKRIRIGAHDGYYRVVIELDGFYKYKFHKEAKKTYIFTLL